MNELEKELAGIQRGPIQFKPPYDQIPRVTMLGIYKEAYRRMDEGMQVLTSVVVTDPELTLDVLRKAMHECHEYERQQYEEYVKEHPEVLKESAIMAATFRILVDHPEIFRAYMHYEETGEIVDPKEFLDDATENETG